MANTFSMDVAASQSELSKELNAIPNLCANWPVARQVLQAISDATTNPFVKMAITIIIAAGNAICGNKP